MATSTANLPTTHDIVGITIGNAETLFPHVAFRVLKQDGLNVALNSNDYSSSRINVELLNGIIVKIIEVG